MIGWSPEVFWSSTARELRLALEGYALARGVKLPSPLDRISLQPKLDRYHEMMANPEPEVKPDHV